MKHAEFSAKKCRDAYDRDSLNRQNPCWGVAVEEGLAVADTLATLMAARFLITITASARAVAATGRQAP